MNEISRVGLLTSGGDAPGMNACVRAVTRSAIASDFEVVGIKRGYAGMIDGDFVDMDSKSVSNILQKGGTVLKSTRSRRFMTEEGRAIAAQNLIDAGIDAIVAIGGDGTFKGATIFAAEHRVHVVGCPGTIDNDLFGTDETIGYDTALNTAIENIDKIRDTADAHNRLFLVEVMGRDAGFIALNSAIGGGAEKVLLPERDTNIIEIKKHLISLMSSHARSSIVVVAEGEGQGGAARLAQELQEDETFDDIDLRVCILGHTQRGGSPTARDRVLASRLGIAAVKALVDGYSGIMVGVVDNDIKHTPLKEVCARKKDIDYDLLNLAQQLST
ncbi:MAG: 6-phosphofructokinase [Rhodothermales bacterium]|nr:6-phosphofructokinase [Rhodothermales bacterium]